MDNRKRFNILENVPQGVMVVDENGSIVYANAAFCELTGFDIDELSTKPAGEVCGGGKVLCLDNNSAGEYCSDTQVYTKNGDTVSVRICVKRGAGEYEDNVFVSAADISGLMHMRVALEQERRESDVIRRLSKDIIFEYYLGSGEIRFSGNFARMFGTGVYFGNLDNTINESQIIEEEDKEALLNFLEAVRGGKTDAYAEFRLKKQDGEIYWFAVEYEILGAGNFRKAVGRLEDVTRQKGIIHALELKSQTDALTALYNKSATRELIEQGITTQQVPVVAYKDSGENAAFFIVDIDNFKSVNDTLGHQYGDYVLTSIASKIRRTFRESDIVGRIGGDEFVVFMRNVSNERVIQGKAAELNAAIRETYESDGKKCRVSCSIGIALFPRHGVSYDELFRLADIALYIVKKAGRDGFHIITEQETTLDRESEKNAR